MAGAATRLPRRTVAFVRLAIAVLVVGALLVVFDRTSRVSEEQARFTIGTDAMQLGRGEHSLWWQSLCHPDVTPELARFDIDLRTEDDDPVEVRSHSPAVTAGDRSELCRFAVGRFDIDEPSTLTVALDTDPSLLPGAMLVLPGDAVDREWLPIAGVPLALGLAFATVAIAARRHDVSMRAALGQIFRWSFT